MSRAFHFALQPLLNHYQGMERSAGIRLSTARRSFNDAMRDADRLHEELKARGDGFARPRSETIDFHLHDAHLEHVHRSILRKRESALTCQAEMDGTQLDLIELAKKRTALEALRARRAKAHAVREQMLEERHIDEANALRHRSVKWT